MPVGATQAVFRRHALLMIVDEDELAVGSVAVVGVDGVEPCGRQAFGLGLAGKFAPALRQEGARAVGLGYPQHGRRRFGKIDKALFALAQRLFGAPALRYHRDLAGRKAKQQAVLLGWKAGARASGHQHAALLDQAKPGHRRLQRLAGDGMGHRRHLGCATEHRRERTAGSFHVHGTVVLAADQVEQAAAFRSGQANVDQVKVQGLEQDLGQADSDALQRQRAPHRRQRRQGDHVAHGAPDLL